jgi:hypothetical protein
MIFSVIFERYFLFLEITLDFETVKQHIFLTRQTSINTADSKITIITARTIIMMNVNG